MSSLLEVCIKKDCFIPSIFNEMPWDEKKENEQGFYFSVFTNNWQFYDVVDAFEDVPLDQFIVIRQEQPLDYWFGAWRDNPFCGPFFGEIDGPQKWLNKESPYHGDVYLGD